MEIINQALIQTYPGRRGPVYPGLSGDALLHLAIRTNMLDLAEFLINRMEVDYETRVACGSVCMVVCVIVLFVSVCVCVSCGCACAGLCCCWVWL